MKYIHFEEIESTNKFLIDNAFSYENLTFVSAGFQSKGKGREDRIWLANKDENLMFSVLIKDIKMVGEFKKLSIAAASIIRQELEKLGLKKVEVKWPNDVYIDSKKVCGILLQGSLPQYLVIGIGINVNQKDFIGEYRIMPTSLSIELGKDVDIENLKESIYRHIELLLTSDVSEINNYIKDARDHDYLKGKRCMVRSYEIIKKVNVLGINEDTSLSIDDDGEIKKINSGEITVL